MTDLPISFTAEVRAALDQGRPVVALESTIITHGMPFPQNLEMARDVEAEIRAGGAVPATIAVIGPNADDPQANLGDWAGASGQVDWMPDGHPRDTVETVLDGFRVVAPADWTVTHARGAEIEVLVPDPDGPLFPDGQPRPPVSQAAAVDPQQLAEAVAAVKAAFSIPIGIHTHNDGELAVANTLAAVRAGARQIECTINGIGERAGNAALEEIVMAVRTRPDAAPYRSGIQTPRILQVSRLLSAITGFDVQPNKAIVGRNAFAHESGIHQDGVLKNAATYEIMTPESVGWTKSNLVMGKHSGRAAFRDKLRSLGYAELGDNQLNDAFRRFKDLADRKKAVYDEDLMALVDDVVLRGRDRIRFVSLDVRAGSRGPQRAELELEIDGAVQRAEATGDGPVDATFNAIRALFPHEARLLLFSVGAVTEGTDAQAKTTVRLEEAGKMVDGQGADTDTIVASARAYVHALNKLLTKRVRTEPAALSA